ncbi:MAG: hypothetical protein ACE5ED_06325 [Rhodothalassiaceae bacterium]
MLRKASISSIFAVAGGLLGLSACAVAAEPPVPPASPDEALARALQPAPEAAPAPDAAAKAGTGEKTVVIVTNGGKRKEWKLDGDSVIFIDESGEIHKLGKGRHRFRFKSKDGEAVEDFDRDVAIDGGLDPDPDKEFDIDLDAMDGERTVNIVRGLDGERKIVIDMDVVRRSVEEARRNAARMQKEAMRHFDSAMKDARRYAYSFDIERYRDRMDRAADALKRAEERMRRAFDRSWDEALSAELYDLARELDRLEDQSNKLAALDPGSRQKLVEARRTALEAARKEIEKAEDIRRKALAEAAEQVRAAREQLRERREELRRAIEDEVRAGQENADKKEKGDR